MIRQASTEIADTEVIQNKLVQNVWRANINPKLKQSVPEEPVRMGLQAIAWVLMLVFFLVVFIYSYLHQRCTTFKSLLSAEDAISNNDGYTCQAVEVPQVFNGQPYYDNAYWWGFGVVSAWGTFRGSNWTAYCGDLMTEVRGVVNFDDQIDSTTWTYSFTNTTDGNSECDYTTGYYPGLNSLPNAPGGVLGCSYPNPFSACEMDDEEVDGADIVGAF
ncbi:unnamed protein product [Ectocarpus sp. CCAP 1310/34]|nr:unnamed protein product [Ectocarpus sp. CCAP 1310/34]